MSDPIFAVSDPAAVLAQALADYQGATGVTLAPADPRRLHLQALLLLLTQQRSLIDFAGKQNLVRFVSDQWIDLLAALWGLTRLPAAPAQCTERFTFPGGGSNTVAAGVSVTDGKNIFVVQTDTTATGTTVDALVVCNTPGQAANGIAEGQIATIVNPTLVPGCSGASNITETVSGRDTEALEDFRARLQNAPESETTCGPRTAYEQNALAASGSVADAVALGPDDGSNMAGTPPNPGQVFVLLLEGAYDDNGNLISVVPQPDGGLISAVSTALSADTVRPLTDQVIVEAPIFVPFNCYVTYYIARSRADSASDIETAVQAAVAAYLLWQQSAIGRSINPSQLIADIVNAGAKRCVITEPAYDQLMSDQSALLIYQSLAFGGIEND